MDKQIEKATWFFFEEGYKTMDKLQQVEFLVDECGYSEVGAWDLIYGTVEDDEPEDSYDYTPEDYYED